MSVNYAPMPNIIGLVLNLAGLLILFRWGMPFQVAIRPGPQINTPASIALDHIYIVCGFVRLSSLLLGIGLQTSSGESRRCARSVATAARATSAPASRFGRRGCGEVGEIGKAEHLLDFREL